MSFSADFLKQLETLSPHDKQEIETFIGYLKYRSIKVSEKTNELVSKVNNEFPEEYIKAMGYVKETIDYLDFDDSGDILHIYFVDRNRPQSFNIDWFVFDFDESLVFYMDFGEKFEDLYIKYRPGTNRIDKIAIPEYYLSEFGKIESKKRILAIPEKYFNNSGEVIKNVEVPLTAETMNVSPDMWKAVSDYKIQSNIKNNLDFKTNGNITFTGANTIINGNVVNDKIDENLITASISKNHEIFKDLNKFVKKARLERIAKIMVNFINKTGSNSYSWSSEFHYNASSDFIDIDNGQSIKVKLIDVNSNSLKLNATELGNIATDFILAALILETENEYKIKIHGYTTPDDFDLLANHHNSGSNLINMNLSVDDLNDAKDLFQ